MESSRIEVNRGTERNFGITFAVVFALIGIYKLWTSGSIVWAAFGASLVLLMIAFAFPSVLRVPNLLWFKFGMLLGRFIGPIVMGIVYLIAMIPMGIFVRITGKDLLHLKLDESTDSYWIQRETPPHPMKNQF